MKQFERYGYKKRPSKTALTAPLLSASFADLDEEQYEAPLLQRKREASAEKDCVPAAMEMLRDVALRATDSERIYALKYCNNDVDAAAEFLLRPKEATVTFLRQNQKRYSPTGELVAVLDTDDEDNNDDDASCRETSTSNRVSSLSRKEEASWTKTGRNPTSAFEVSN